MDEKSRINRSRNLFIKKLGKQGWNIRFIGDELWASRESLHIRLNATVWTLYTSPDEYTSAFPSGEELSIVGASEYDRRMTQRLRRWAYKVNRRLPGWK